MKTRKNNILGITMILLIIGCMALMAFDKDWGIALLFGLIPCWAALDKPAEE